MQTFENCVQTNTGWTMRVKTAYTNYAYKIKVWSQEMQNLDLVITRVKYEIRQSMHRPARANHFPNGQAAQAKKHILVPNVLLTYLKRTFAKTPKRTFNLFKTYFGAIT